jgi:hypothetical protein
MRTRFTYLALVIVLVCPIALAQWVKINTVAQLPDSVVLVEPANNAILFTTYVRFVWQSSQPHVVRYWLELATDSSFESSKADTAIVDTTKDIVVDTFMDLNQPEASYWWRVKARNLDGWGPFSETWTFITSPCGMDDLGSIPKEFLLAQSFPNPVNLRSTIKYELPRASHVTLKVYDLLGREVATLVDGLEDAGYKLVRWNASGLASGVYFYRLQAGHFIQARKLLLLK